MSSLRPPSSPYFDADFDLARRAVEAGLLTETQVEEALLAHERSPSRRLVECLPLSEESLRDLRTASTRAVPAEAAAAMTDPRNRCGAYWIVSKLGEGGMGEVFRAWDGKLGRWVALKFPKPSGPLESTERFVREAGLAAGLDHPNIAKVYEVGEVAGRPFIAMPLIEGQTLDRAARGAGRERIMEWVRQVAAGVAAAHAAGVIHRDLKPSNVMIDSAGHVFVLDFGLAKSTTVGASIPSASGFVVGTPNYMAPEQASGRSDARSDVYGLGALLYEAVTGRPPFVGETATEVLLQVLDRDPVPPRRLDPGASRDCEAIILKCLEKDPGRRYAGIAEFMEDLDACLRREPLRHARRRTLGYVLGKQIRRQPLLWSLGVLTAILLLTGGVLAALWATSPGTVRLHVTPAGARVRTGAGDFAADSGPVTLELPAGVAEIRIEAAGHVPQTIPVVVRRRGAQDLRVDLRHEQGSLEANADPPDAGIAVDGADYGARIRGLALDTGRHRLQVRAPGCFVARRDIEVLKDLPTRVDVSLEVGEAWRFRSDEVQAGCNTLALPDVDGDGAEDVAVAQLRHFVVLSGTSGAVIRREVASSSPQWTMQVLDVGAFRFLGGWSDSTEGLRLVLLDLAPGRRAERRLDWREPGASRADARPACAAVAPDLDGDGLPEIVVCGRGGRAWIVNVATGGARPVDLPPGASQVTSFGLSGALMAFAARSHDRTAPAGEHVLGAVSLENGAAPWTDRAEIDHALVFHAGSPPVPRIFVYGKEGWSLRDGLGPRVFQAAKGIAEGAWFVDRDGDGSADLLAVGRDGALAAWEPVSGAGLWSTPLAAAQDVRRGPGRSLLVRVPTGLTLLDAADGGALWSVPGSFDQCLVADLDGDGSLESVAGGPGGLSCFSAGGSPLWSLDLRNSPRPLAVLDSGEERRVVFGRGSAFVGLARTPRELWHAQADGPLLAPAVVARGRDGLRVLLQQGDWGSETCLRAFEARTGDHRWSLVQQCVPNAAPASGDLDGDGEDEVVEWASLIGGKGHGLLTLGARDGATRRFSASPFPADCYATPLIADLDGDTHPDIAVNTRFPAEAVAVSGRTGQVLWRKPLGGESWGRMAAVDLDGDRLPDLVVPADGRPLRACRGRDGELLWESRAGTGGHAAPSTFPGSGSSGPAIVHLDGSGDLRVLRGTDGAVLGERQCGPEAGQAVVTRDLHGRRLFLVSAGNSGLSAVGWPGMGVAWTLDAPVTAPAASGDLDGDGIEEVVAATDSGLVVILDRATGLKLWTHQVSPEGCVAAPVLADLDEDGLPEILVSDKSGRVTLVSGRPTRAARR